jgi:hypothetical protein
MSFDRADEDSRLSLLVVTQGQWGERIAENVRRTCPDNWTLHQWPAPRALPPVIDDPDDYLPPELPPVDLVLSLGETPGVVQLIPDIVRMSGAKSVIAPIDRNESLPPGLVHQLQAWLDETNTAVVFPKPFCSLTETTYNRPPIQVTYDDPIIRRFAQRYGQPQLKVAVDSNKRIESVEIERDSACGCALAVAQGLVGWSVDEAEFKAGMLHHHYPCLASMNQDSDYQDTLMHISGHILQEAVTGQIKDHLEPTPYLRPMGRVED